MLLFPDMSREQHEAQEFCFCDPCTKEEWRRLKHQVKCTREGYLPHVIKHDDSKEEIAIILRGTWDTDEDCVTTAAYLRLVHEFSGMIYALPFREGSALTSQPMSAIIARTAGVPFFQVRHIEV
jgi:hypothetical protein